MQTVPRFAAAGANQPPPLAGYDVFSADAALGEAVARYGAAWALDALRELGRRAGSEDAIAWGFEANRHPPELRTHDRYGERIDEVAFHPAWHRLMDVAVTHGLHAAPWADARPGAHVARAAAFSVWTQVEAGHGCPISMTYAAVPALRAEPRVFAQWFPLLTSRAYDPGLRPAAGKRGALCGMGMTERQGGSDVRANTTQARPLERGGSGEWYVVDGQKWFCSAPMCDAFVILAQAPEGLSCFLLPRVLPDGTRNGVRIERLKDKLGNRSNASSEMTFAGAHATLVGEPGRGIATIIEMVNHTRLDCVVGSAAGMRQAVAQAIHHASYRRAFGARLADQPLMRAVLADLALESEAATALALRLARACDAAPSDAAEAHLRRIATAAAKYYVCKRAAAHAAEALECLGGNGYVEECIMPRLYREAPLNSIWEGAGNINALDVLRAARKTPAAVDAFFDEVALAADARIARAAERLRAELREAPAEARARRLVERMTILLQAALLVRHAPAAVADGFCATRLDAEGARTYGAYDAAIDERAIVERARPALSVSRP